MISNEKIAHDLALLWVQNALDKKVPPMTKGLLFVEEYLAAYKEAIEKLDRLNPSGKITSPTQGP